MRSQSLRIGGTLWGSRAPRESAASEPAKTAGAQPPPLEVSYLRGPHAVSFDSESSYEPPPPSPTNGMRGGCSGMAEPPHPAAVDQAVGPPCLSSTAASYFSPR